VKKIKRYLLILALASTALFTGYSWLGDVVEDVFLTGVSEGVEEAIKDEAEGRLKEKLFGLLEGVLQ